MGHFKVTQFEGEAEIIGYLKQVSFSDGRLCINGLNITQARLCIEHLSTGQLHGESENFNAEMAHKPLDPPMSKSAPNTETAAVVAASKSKVDALVAKGRKQAAVEKAKEPKLAPKASK